MTRWLVWHGCGSGVSLGLRPILRLAWSFGLRSSMGGILAGSSGDLHCMEKLVLVLTYTMERRLGLALHAVRGRLHTDVLRTGVLRRELVTNKSKSRNKIENSTEQHRKRF
jgi:hypothetical protein